MLHQCRPETAPSPHSLWSSQLVPVLTARSSSVKGYPQRRTNIVRRHGTQRLWSREQGPSPGCARLNWSSQLAVSVGEMCRIHWTTRGCFTVSWFHLHHPLHQTDSDGVSYPYLPFVLGRLLGRLLH